MKWSFAYFASLEGIYFTSWKFSHNIPHLMTNPRWQLEGSFYCFMLTSMLEADQGCDEFQKAERVSIMHNIKMWIYTQQEMQ